MKEQLFFFFFFFFFFFKERTSWYQRTDTLASVARGSYTPSYDFAESSTCPN